MCNPSKKKGKIVLFTNNGSLYWGKLNNDTYFSSEIYPLKKLIAKVSAVTEPIIIDTPLTDSETLVTDYKLKEKLSSDFLNNVSQEKLLKYQINKTTRCTKCILLQIFHISNLMN